MYYQKIKNAIKEADVQATDHIYMAVDLANSRECTLSIEALPIDILKAACHMFDETKIPAMQVIAYVMKNYGITKNDIR